MKAGMTNVDVAALAAELAALLPGARLDKAYQPGKDEVLLRLRRKGTGRLDLVCRLGDFLTLTQNPPQNPDQPSMVAKVLRKELGNARVKDVCQVGFDRLLRLDLERGDGVRGLVFELFGEGNMLLLDADDRILLPMRGVEHGARRLKRGEPYQPPPGGAQPFAMDEATFAARGRQAARDVVRFLAVDLGFGPLWAEELCLRADVKKSTKVGGASDAQWRALWHAVHALGDDIRRNDLAPAVVYDGDKAVDAVPFLMQKYPAPQYAVEEAATFREALDGFFLGVRGGDQAPASTDPRQARFDEAVGRLERQAKQMREAVARFEQEAVSRHGDGDALYASFQDVQTVLEDLQAARREHSWESIRATLAKARAEGHPGASRVLDLRPHEASALLRVQDMQDGGRDVEVDVRHSVQENAEAHYEAAKRARARGEGAAAALHEVESRIAAMRQRGLDGFGPAPTAREEAPTRHFWFEQYRWTVTPGGLLAVGGRNAAQNDAVVKKYLRDGDRYVHAEIHGAPSVVLRAFGDAPTGEVADEDLRAVAQFAACASRAWRQFGAASAYWVTPQQVSKTPRSGEFVPRGAWIIHGRRNTLDGLPMEWAVGPMRLGRRGVPDPEGEVVKLVGGPPAGVRAHAREVVLVVPGDMDPNEAAALLAERFDVSVEDAQAALPPGPVRIEEADA